MPARFHPAAIALHWVMAVGFLLMFASGLAIEWLELPQKLKFSLFQWHKSLGVLLLCAFFLRLGVRLVAPCPKLPPEIPPLERRAAGFGHFALYACMLLVPLAGWVMVSSSSLGLPTIVFGLFTWPHVPGVAGEEGINGVAHTAHAWLAYAFMALVAGHVAAVVKHQVVDRIRLLPRMGIGKGGF